MVTGSSNGTVTVGWGPLGVGVTSGSVGWHPVAAQPTMMATATKAIRKKPKLDRFTAQQTWISDSPSRTYASWSTIIPVNSSAR